MVKAINSVVSPEEPEAVSSASEDVKRPDALLLDEVKGDRHLTPLLWLWLTDFFVFLVSMLLGYWVRFNLIQPVIEVPDGTEQAGVWAYITLGVVASCLGSLIFERWGIYRHRFGFERSVHSISLFSAVLFTYLLLHFPLLLARTWISGPVLVTSMFVTMAGVWLVHTGYRWLQPILQASGIGFDRTLLIGAPNDCEQVAHRLQQVHGSQYPVLGFLGPSDSNVSLRRFGGLSNLARILRTQRVDYVLLASRCHDHQQVLDIVDQCSVFGVSCRVLPDTFELITGKVVVGEIPGVPTMTLGETPLSGSGAVVKRIEDLLLASIGIIVTGLVLLFFGPLIKLTSRGPLFYKQERIGLDGRVFAMYKFRTMHVDAEQTTGPVWATPNDPRTTAIGAFMRQHNLDELPQFFNVLRGDMSVVGPRPERPHFINEFKKHIPGYMRRHLVKCGMTGWAQVCGLRGDTSIEERTRCDIWYIENWSLWLDFQIVLRTLCKNRNAY